MFGSKFSGIEITVHNADTSVSIKPIYEAHTTAKALEIIEATQRLIAGSGKTITWRLF